jgi:hypothetical protein
VKPLALIVTPILALSVFVVGIAGCGGSEHGAGKTQAPAAAATVATTAPASSTPSQSVPAAVARVAGGAPVSYGEYAPEYELALRAEPDAGKARDQAMRVVLYRNWVEQAASQAGVSGSVGEVHSGAEEQLGRLSESHAPAGAPEASGGKSSSAAAQQQAEQQYLRANGLTLADLEAEARTQLLRAKLSAGAAHAATAALVAKLPTVPASVPSGQLVAYYDAHKQKLAQPGTRDVEIVRFHTAAEASKGLAGLRRGESFRRVGHIDPELNRTDNYAERESVTPPGYVPASGISNGEDPTIAKAAFAATPGTIVGPVKGSPPYVAYFILRVLSESPGAPKPLSAVRSEVASLVASENQRTLAGATRDATESFEKQFVNTWRAKTVCAAGYVMGYCANDRSGVH